MRKIYVIIALLVLGLATTGLSAEKKFKADLSGDQVVPPVTTTAKGNATFELSGAGEKMSYEVKVSNIENVAAMHIHMGKMGQDGPPIVPLKTDGKKGKFTGTLAKGVITSKELTGPLAGKSLKDLVAEIEAGNAYLNVHTAKYPNGEIRGQIK